MTTPASIGAADEGLIVLGWLTKLVLGLALLGLVVFDVIALATTSVNAADHANHDASLAADTYLATKNAQLAYNAAVAEAARNAETIDPKSFKVFPDGHVTLTVQKTATTLWMHKVGFLKKYTKITGDGEGSPPT